MSPTLATDNPALYRALVTVAIMLAAVMQALDTTIANVALPNMQGSLSASSEQIAWVLTSYIVAAAIMTPMSGFLAGQIGRKRLLQIAVSGFIVASLLCGLSTSLGEIVVFRVLQGMFGSALVPMSQSVLLDTYPRERHGSAMALWGMGVMLGPILGPTLGGYLTEYYSWRWVFFINLPLGLVALTGVTLFVHGALGERRRFDGFGFFLLALAIGSLQLMLDRGQSQNWFSSTEIITEACLAAMGLYLFLAHMFTAKHPFLRPGLFRDRNLVTGLVFIFAVGIILLATLALLPPYLQHLMGYPVVTTGLVLAPRGVGSLIAMTLVGRLIQRVDIRLLMLFGLILTATSLMEMAHFNLQISSFDIVETGLTQGLGIGFLFVPLSTITFATLDPQYRSEGTAMFSLMRNVGSSVGISIMTTLAARNLQINHAAIGEALTPFRDAVQPLFGGPMDPGSTAGLMLLNQQVTAQAAAIGYLNDFRLMGWITLAVIPLLALLRSPQGPSARKQREQASREPVME